MAKLLRVNLTEGRVSSEDVNPKIQRNFIGGLGLGVKYLYDEIDPKVEPLSPENKLIFATGPLTGTGAQAGSRYMVVTKSPLTGAIANSNAGGYFPAEMRFAGYDMLIFEGKSAIPVYLWINDGEAEIRSAEKLWGKDTHETQDLIRAETDKKARIACIGPAGENLVKLSCVINDDGRAAGRSGVGAVMGSKNLKAVAVRGTKRPAVFDKEGLKKVIRDCRKMLNSEQRKDELGFYYKYGTTIAMTMVNEFGVLPTRNFQSGVFEKIDKVNEEVYANTISAIGKAGRGCYSCPILCARVTRVTEPKEFAGEGFGPEFESLGALTSACGVDDIKAATKANYICNEMGMDTISVGMTIACAMDLFERGFLPEEDVGYKLNFGNAHAMVELAAKMAKRAGFGDILAEGSYRLAEKYGHPELFMGVRKQEFPLYDSRGLQGQAIAFATANRGADHIRAEVHNVELYLVNVQLYGFPNKEAVDADSIEGKPELCKAIQDDYSVIDSSGLCSFFAISLNFEQLRDFLNSAAGFNFSVDEMRKAGERIFNIQRLFNQKAGFTGKDDTLPLRFLEEPMPDGPHKGHVAELDKTLPKYYKLRGWDENGFITQAKLEELGLA